MVANPDDMARAWRHGACIKPGGGPAGTAPPRPGWPRQRPGLESARSIQCPSRGLLRRPTPGETMERGRFRRTYGPGAHSRANLRNQLAAAPHSISQDDFPHAASASRACSGRGTRSRIDSAKRPRRQPRSQRVARGAVRSAGRGDVAGSISPLPTATSRRTVRRSTGHYAGSTTTRSRWRTTSPPTGGPSPSAWRTWLAATCTSGSSPTVMATSPSTTTRRAGRSRSWSTATL